MKKIFITIMIIILVIIIGGFTYNFINQTGRQYEILEVSEYNYFILKQNNLNGVIDKKGNTIIPTNYEDIKIPNPEKAVFIC